MSQSLPPILSQAPPAQPAAVLQGWPLLRLGFRPFYLAAALLACLSVPLWVAVFLGHARLDLPISPLLWHAHEMLFGFAAGVIVGFLLTAVKAWTGLPTPRGVLLGLLALLWVAARLAAVTAPYVVYAALDVALLPIVAGILLRVLLKSGNKRNIPLISILVLMSLANLAFHLAAAGVIDISPLSPLYAGLALIVMIECVMTGRVVPMFTKSVTPGLVITVPRRFELGTLAVTALALALWVFAPAGLWTLSKIMYGQDRLTQPLLRTVCACGNGTRWSRSSAPFCGFFMRPMPGLSWALPCWAWPRWAGWRCLRRCMPLPWEPRAV